MYPVIEPLGNSGPLYPIREVSRLTQVNTVTLRAWERRYGLLRPQRTPKGHRLYSKEDIERVYRILEWLERGINVSQVAELLDHPSVVSTCPATQEDLWLEYQQRSRQQLRQLDEAGLDQLYDGLLARWSAEQLNQHWLRPLLTQLADDPASLAVLARFLRTRIGERLAHRRPLLTGPKLLLAHLGQYRTNKAWLHLLAIHSLIDADYRVMWLDHPLPASALLPLVISYQPRWAILTGSHAALNEMYQQVQASPRLATQWFTLERSAPDGWYPLDELSPLVLHHLAL